MDDRAHPVALLSALVLCMSCESASGLSGVTALLRVEGAQLVPGAPPTSEEGPEVRGVTLLQSHVWPGQLDKPITGALAPGATAVSLYLIGDRVHYVLPAMAADITAPEQPTFAARLSFSPLLPQGAQQLVVQATDAAGRYGAAAVQALLSAEEPAPQGALVFTLRWERAADLDLHVEEPSGAEIWSRRKTGTSPSLPPTGMPMADGGYLDADANAQCLLDGRQRESVIYPLSAPPGRYRVRVDTFSLCGQTTAYWRLEVRAQGQLLAEARGQSLPSSTRGQHGQGAGELALGLEIP